MDTPIKKQYSLYVRKMEVLLGSYSLTDTLREKVREMILALVETELTEVLAAVPYERTGNRKGYRNGSKQRSPTTSLGKITIDMPRAPVVISALPGAYINGTNQRRKKRALSPEL